MTHQPPDPSVPAPLSAAEEAVANDLAARLHHDGCIHDDAGGRFCWSLALIFRSRFATLDAERQPRAADPTPDAALDRFYRLIDGPEPHDYEIVVPVGILRKAASLIWQRGTENGANVARTADPHEEGLREALEQALDDLETAFHRLTPEFTADDHEALAQTLWFGQERARRALEVNDRGAAAEPAGLPLDADVLEQAIRAANFTVHWRDSRRGKMPLPLTVAAQNIAREYVALVEVADGRGG